MIILWHILRKEARVGFYGDFMVSLKNIGGLLRGRKALKSSKLKDEYIEICGFIVKIRRNKRSRYLRLRLDRREDIIIVSAPVRAKVKEVRSFVLKYEGWVLTQIEKRPDIIFFEDGVVIPYRGVEYKIEAIDASCTPVRLCVENRVIYVPRKNLARRLEAWFREEARRYFTKESGVFAGYIDREIVGISIKDTKTRWGSCSSKGRLNFSWRLMLAPDDVRLYLAAHEVSHLKYRNHSKEFWGLCDELCRKENIDMKEGKLWLRKNGDSLMRVGVQKSEI